MDFDEAIVSVLIITRRVEELALSFLIKRHDVLLREEFRTIVVEELVDR